MINEPVSLVFDSFQSAWVAVVRALTTRRWELRNLVVQIRNPAIIDDTINDRVADFARAHEFLAPRHVAYTIFPHGLYRDGRDAAALFRSYNRKDGLYERLHRRKPGWGTYFRRLTQYETPHGPVNQLGNIIDAVRNRTSLSKAAYTAIIQSPGGETIRPLGGPCLNYLAIQAEPGPPVEIGILAVYRNHDFLKRAYGNYWGLCNLLRFVAHEIGATAGPLTCVSSHAFVSGKKAALQAFVGLL